MSNPIDIFSDATAVQNYLGKYKITSFITYFTNKTGSCFYPLKDVPVYKTIQQFTIEYATNIHSGTIQTERTMVRSASTSTFPEVIHWYHTDVNLG